MEQASLFQHPDRVDRTPVDKTAHAAVIEGWARLWKLRHHVDWAWQAKDFKAFKQMLKQAGSDVTVVLGKAERMLFYPPSPWYEQMASPTILASHWNNPKLSPPPKKTAARGHNLISAKLPGATCRICGYTNVAQSTTCKSCGRAL